MPKYMNTPFYFFEINYIHLKPQNTSPGCCVGPMWVTKLCLLWPWLQVVEKHTKWTLKFDLNLKQIVISYLFIYLIIGIQPNNSGVARQKHSLDWASDNHWITESVNRWYKLSANTMYLLHTPINNGCANLLQLLYNR